MGIEKLEGVSVSGVLGRGACKVLFKGEKISWIFSA